MRFQAHHDSFRWLVALVSAAMLAAFIVIAQPAPRLTSQAATGPHSQTAVLAETASTSAATGASDIANLGAAGWKVLTSATATQTGAQISTPGFATSCWLPGRDDDGGGPGTEIEALRRTASARRHARRDQQRGHSVFFSTNMKSCFGSRARSAPSPWPSSRSRGGTAPTSRRASQSGQYASLVVNGVVG